MKKLFALLLIAPILFVACGDDKKEEETYYNPVEGEWVYTTPMGNTETRIYTKDFNASVYSQFNKLDTTINIGKYSIDSIFIYYETSTHNYVIKEDTLWSWVKGENINLNKKFIKKK